MADLQKHVVYKNTKYQVLTDKGFKDFKGLIVGENNNKVCLCIDNKIKLVCTPKHKLMLDDTNYVYAKDINIGDVLYNNHKVTSVEKYQNSDKVYELLHVQDTHKYYVNDILSRQCLIVDEMAFIPDHLMQDFWKSVIPVISSSITSKVFVVSTPNGAGNKFHEIYTGAESGRLEEWHHDRIDWWEVPGRGKKWKESMIQLLAKEDKAFEQEFGNSHGPSCMLTINNKQLTEEKNITMSDLWKILAQKSYNITK